MKRAFVQFVLRASYLILASTALNPPITAVEAAENPIDAIRNDLIRKWSQLFGPVNFSYDPNGCIPFLYICYIHPQQEEVFQDIRNKRLSGTLFVDVHNQFFKKGIVPEAAVPKKYYLPRKTGTDAFWSQQSSLGQESGLVWWEWAYKSYSFRMLENGSGVLVRIQPKGMNMQTGIAGSELARILYEIFDLRYEAPDLLKAGFRFADRMEIGDVFSNTDRWIAGSGNWYQYVVGFISKEDICVICLKSFVERQVPAFLYRPTWLGEGLLECDGRTLVATGQPAPDWVALEHPLPRPTTPKNAKELAKMLTDPDPEYRLRVIGGLELTAANVRPYLDVIGARYSREPASEVRRQIAFQFLSDTDTKRALRFLRRAYMREANKDVREFIAELIETLEQSNH